MRLAREYIHSRRGYRFGSRCLWVRLYEGEAGDAPVVVCEGTSQLGAAGVAELSEYLAAEVVD